MMWFRQMAQLSTTISQAQRATAFHYFCQYRRELAGNNQLQPTFLTSNFFLSEPLVLAVSAPLGASLISTSAMSVYRKFAAMYRACFE